MGSSGRRPLTRVHHAPPHNQAVAQQELQKTMFDQERTTNRVLSDREKELQEAIKQLEAERSEFQFMQSTVQPVKVRERGRE